MKRKVELDINPLMELFNKEAPPEDFSYFIDEMFYDYMIMYFRLLPLGEVNVQGDVEEYIFYLMKLKKALFECRYIIG